MFTEDEITALVLGMRIVKGRTDGELARAAEDVLVKVETVGPQRLKSRIASATLFAPSLVSSIGVRNHLGPLRKAIDDRQKVRLHYESAGGVETVRIAQGQRPDAAEQDSRPNFPFFRLHAGALIHGARYAI